MRAERISAVCAAVMIAAACCGCESSSSVSDSTAGTSAAESSAAETTVSSAVSEEVSSAPQQDSLPAPDSGEDASSAAEPVIVVDPLDEYMEKLPERELEDKTVRRLAHTGLDPETPSSRLFAKKYSGTVETETVPFQERYTRLSAMVMSNESPDIVPTDDMDLFPKGAADKLFAPIDGYIDFSSELWSDTADRSSFFRYRSGCYAAVIETLPEYVCIYNRDTVKEYGLKDPAELYADGLWTQGWFETMCTEFTDAEKGRFALDGLARPEALSAAGGVPLITMESGGIIQNLGDDRLADIQNWMYTLADQGVRSDSTAEDGLAKGETLFLPAELSLLTEGGGLSGRFGNVMFVPVPAESVSYASAKLRGYFLCAGSKNPEGAAAYLDCLKASAEPDNEAKEQHLMEDCGWSEEMTVMLRQCAYQAAESPVLDCTRGLPEEIYNNLKLGDVLGRTMQSEAVSWDDTVKQLRPQLSYAVMRANDTGPAGP